LIQGAILILFCEVAHHVCKKLTNFGALWCHVAGTNFDNFWQEDAALFKKLRACSTFNVPAFLLTLFAF